MTFTSWLSYIAGNPMGRRRKRQIWLPGESGDEFLGEDTGGEAGQYIIMRNRAIMICAPSYLAVGPFGYTIPDLLYIPGDGNTPTIGPLMQSAGTPSAGISPYHTLGAVQAASEIYTTADRRETVDAFDPGVADDVVIHTLVRMPRTLATSRILATWSGGVGFELMTQQIGSTRLVFNASDGVITEVLVHAEELLGAWCFISIIINRSTSEMRMYTNAVLRDTEAIPTLGDIAASSNLAMFSRPGGASTGEGEIAFLWVRYAAGIAASWLANGAAMISDIVARMTGYCPCVGACGIFTRVTAASWHANGKWRVASDSLCRSGDSVGLRIAPQRTNLCYRNINPQNVTAISYNGVKAPTVVDDSVALAAAGCEDWGPNVYEYDNTTGATRELWMSAQTGDTADYRLSGFVRIVSGVGTVRIGWHDISAGTFTNAKTVTSGYATRNISARVSPPDTDCVFAIQVPNGVKIRWFGHQLEKGNTPSSPIPNWAYVASSLRTEERHITVAGLVDAQGSVEATVTPQGWSSGDPLGTVTLFSLDSGAFPLDVQGGTTYRAYDGVTSVTAGSPSNGVPNTARVRWKGNRLSIDVDGVVDVDTYDGTIFGAGDLRAVGGTAITAAEFAIREMNVYRNGDG